MCIVECLTLGHLNLFPKMSSVYSTDNMTEIAAVIPMCSEVGG